MPTFLFVTPMFFFSGTFFSTERLLAVLHVVGGGSQNHYLNHLIAQRTALDVVRGPVECSTNGNLAVQFASLECGGSALTPADVARWAARLNISSST